MSSQHTGKVANQEDFNTLNNTIDFFNELQMGSTIKKAQFMSHDGYKGLQGDTTDRFVNCNSGNSPIVVQNQLTDGVMITD